MVTGVEELTLAVVIVKFALEAPAATFTLAGPEAAAESLDRLTLRALVAATFNVTVPVTTWPPVAVDGLTETDCSATGGFTVKLAKLVTPL